MNTFAEQLNNDLKDTILASLLSPLGKRLYFPKGVVVQAQEAAKKASRFDATAGIAKINAQPMILASVQSLIPEFTSRDIVGYAPTSGIQELREIWNNELLLKNPSLKNKSFSLPLVTTGITHGLAVAADLFADINTTVILPDLSWENYQLIFHTKHEAEIIEYPFFNEKHQFNCIGLLEAVKKAETEKILIIFNFPHNPTGFSPLKDDIKTVSKIIEESAAAGKKIGVLCDDAYFGLFWEKETIQESLFSVFADLHENVLAVKLDGATKEDFGWGLRIGFITFAGKSISTETQFHSIEQKTLAAIRSSVSSASMTSQKLLTTAYSDPLYHAEKAEAIRALETRYKKAKTFLSVHPHRKLTILPFNSGYFLCMKTTGINAETLQKKLLEEKQIGTVSVGPSFLRVTYACVDEENINALFTNIWECAEKL